MIFTSRNRLRRVLQSESSTSSSASVSANATKIEKSKAKDKVAEKSSVCSNDSREIVKEPAYWRQHLENVRLMRQNRDAQVDKMGAHACVMTDSSPKDKRFQILVALLLSSQTKDEVTSQAVARLNTEFNGMSAVKIAHQSADRLAELIYPVGFYKKKGEYLKKVAEILVEKFQGDVPQHYEQLCSLPGVGQKMATLAISIAHGQVVGIGVDTHVHRVSNRLGWTNGGTKTAEATKKALEDWLPCDLWEEMNILFVGFGQQVCTPVRPKCDSCLNKNICPYAMVYNNNPSS